MAKTTAIADAPTLRRLQAKEALYDELVEQLADTERELEATRAELAGQRRQLSTHRYEGVWRAITNDLAGALRPYTLFGQMTVEDGRCVIHTRVPPPTLRRAQEALQRLAREVARESYREVEMTPSDEDEAVA